MKKFFYTVWICLYPVIIYTVIQFMAMLAMCFLCGIMGIATVETVIDFVSQYTLQLTAISAVISFVLLIVFFYFDKKRGRIRQNSNARILDYIMAALGGAGIAIVLNIIISISGIIKFDAVFKEVSSEMLNTPFALSILCVGIILPIIEEVIFRGLIFNRIKYQYNYIAAIIISSIAFGIYHGNITQGIYATVMGFGLAYAYNKTDSLLIPVCIHISANVTVACYGQLSNGGVSSSFENAAIEFAVLILCLIFAVSGVIYFKLRKVKE